MSTFKRPLGKKTSSPFQNVSNDVREIGRIYREQLGGNPFGIEPEKPPWRCDYCQRTTTAGTCSGACGFG